MRILEELVNDNIVLDVYYLYSSCHDLVYVI
jgi:hypothetical protein